MRAAEAPLIIHRAGTSAATFLVASGLAPLLLKIDSADSILTTLKRCANRWFYFQTKEFFLNMTVKHGLVKHLNETGIKHVQPLLQLLGISSSYSLSFVKICI